MKLLRSVIIGAVLWISAAGAAFAQCGTSAPANKFCGGGSSAGLATWLTIPTGALTPIPGGTVIGNNTMGSAVPSATTAPVLGIPGTSTGQLGLAGSGSGTATLKAQTAAGSAVILLPTSAGTLVGTATAPLAINAVTGLISITGQAGGVLAGAGATFTATPVLGVPNTSQGSLGFAGASGGTATVTAQATAGTPTLTLPNTSGTLADGASSPLVLSATTGNLTCPTCVTSSGGGAITGVAPIAVSAAGAVSINAPYGSLTANTGGIVYSGATNLAILSGTATARQMLQSGATAAPAWSTATWPATSTINQLLYSSSANTVVGLATANGGVLNTSSSGVPSITNAPVLGVAGSSVGTVGFQNASTGTVTISPPAGALGTVTNTLQAVADTFVYRATTDTLTNKTLTTPTINGASLSGTLSGTPTFSGNLTFSGVPIMSGLSSTTCSSGLAIDASNNVIKASCPGSATSVTVGTTTVTGATVGLLGFSSNGGVLQSFPRSKPVICDIISTSAVTCNNGGSQANNGSYTSSSGALYTVFELVGGGSGGNGSGTSAVVGSAGTNSTVNTTTTAPGASAAVSLGVGAAGGVTGANCDFTVAGQDGQPADQTIANPPGAAGGSSFLGGGGSPPINNSVGGTAKANTGSGGGGAGPTTGVAASGGGGAGAYCRKIFAAGTFAYTVGPGGAAGTGGTASGGAGAGGRIIATDVFN